MPIIVREHSLSPWYTQLWPWLLISGPLTVILAGSITCWIAFHRQDALVVDDYYKQGNAINKDLRRDNAATDRGLSTEIKYDVAKDRLIGRLLSFGLPVNGKITLLFSHSTQPEKDKRIEVQADSNGNFETPLPFWESGRWQITIEDDNRDWRLKGSWKWPQQQTLKIKADLPSAE